MRHFLVVNPLTLATHYVFCHLPADHPLLCQALYTKYWSKLNGNRPAFSYFTKPGFLFPDMVTMKEEMQFWFQGHSYEDGFRPGEVPSTEERQRRIYTNDILSVVHFEKKRNIFGETIVVMFLTRVISFYR